MPSSNALLVDSGFFFALFDPRDQHHADACEKQDWLEELSVVIPWPILYETINTRFVRRPETIVRFESILRARDTVLLDDSPYRFEAIDVDGDGIVEHFVYGTLNSKTLDLTTRLNVIFSRDLSLELYLQPFLAVGSYKHFKELVGPSSYMFTPYAGLDYNPDFRSRSLQSNMVLRWEYRPGSTLFLVWSQANSAFSSDPSFLPLKNIGESFLDDGSDIFFIKVNYWLSL